ncbi:MAG: dephospho-CoA kinase [Chloroflexi bacterium]|nr:dephospho-CoA kinase [Chloroflexota bacterium]
MKILGITGGIGSGKSSVLRLLESNNIIAINSDKIISVIIQNDQDIQQFCNKKLNVNLYDDEINFQINKQRLAHVLFNDKNLLHEFEKIIWPKALIHIKKQITITNHFFLLEASKLFEAKWDQICDRVITIEANKEICIARVLNRSNLSRRQISIRMNNQLSSKHRRYLSDFILDNNFTFKELEEKVKYFSKNNLIT